MSSYDIYGMPPPPPPRPALNDRQIARMEFRVRLFMHRGMPEPNAERWADVLVDRDSSRDERRLCIECRAFQPSAHERQGATCFRSNRDRRITPVHGALQRCPLFEFQKP